jgi:hypothetical protein
LLAGLAASKFLPLPSKAWVNILPVLSRDLILYEAELPTLSNAQWFEVCSKRFRLASIIAAEAEKQAHEDATGNWRRNRWRQFFLKTLGKMEHRDESACLAEDHHVCRKHLLLPMWTYSDVSARGQLKYVVLHRKHGLARSRISAREFDPLRVFEELK